LPPPGVEDPDNVTVMALEKIPTVDAKPAPSVALESLAEPVDAIAVELTTGAMDLQIFPGRLLGRHLSLPERFTVARMHAPDGDFRPWDDIVDWTKEIVRYLRDEPVAPSEARRADASG